jgi:hypothetical protein
MPWCSTCNEELREGQGTLVASEDVKKGIQVGFGPPLGWLERRARLMHPPTVETAEATWKKTFEEGSADKCLLCDACRGRLSITLEVLGPGYSD